MPDVACPRVRQKRRSWDEHQRENSADYGGWKYFDSAAIDRNLPAPRTDVCFQGPCAHFLDPGVLRGGMSLRQPALHWRGNPLHVAAVGRIRTALFPLWRCRPWSIVQI